MLTKTFNAPDNERKRARHQGYTGQQNITMVSVNAWPEPVRQPTIVYLVVRNANTGPAPAGQPSVLRHRPATVESH